MGLKDGHDLSVCFKRKFLRDPITLKTPLKRFVNTDFNT
jgi:hypothetical protein